MAATYVFDPTGRSPANLVPGEQHVVTNNNYKNYYLIVPKSGPFFINSAVLTQSINGSTRTLVEGVDWYPVFEFVGATRSIGVPVYGGMSFTDMSISGIVSITYQTIGGEWVFDDSTILESMANKAYNPFTTTWEEVSGVPTQFPVVNHIWNLVDMVGETEVVAGLVAIENAILSKTPTIINTATKVSIGLGNVQNYAPATLSEALAGASTQTLITPATMKAALASVAAGVAPTDLAPLIAADAAQQANTSALSNQITAHLQDKLNPHTTTAAQVGLGNVENLPVATDAEVSSGVSVRKYITAAQLALASTGGGGNYNLTIDLSTGVSSKFYPVWWSPPSIIRANGVPAEYTLFRKTDDAGASGGGPLTLTAESSGTVWDSYINAYTKVKFFSQPQADHKFIRCFKHGLKSIFRNKNKGGINLPAFPTQVSGQISLCGPLAGCYLRGGYVYQLTTNSLTIKNTLHYTTDDVEKEVFYDVQSAAEGGWYARSYADGDTFLETDYTSMNRDDAFFTWVNQPSVYTFTIPVSATFTWSNSSVLVAPGGTASVSANLTLLPPSANLSAKITYTKQSGGTPVVVNQPFTSDASGNYTLTNNPTLNPAQGDVFNVSAVITRVDNGDVLVTSSIATISISTPVLSTGGTFVTYVGQVVNPSISLTNFGPNSNVTLRFYLVKPNGDKTPWLDYNNAQITRTVTTNSAGALATTTVFTNDGNLTSGVWRVAFDTIVGGVTYTSTNNSSITINPVSITVPGTANINTGGSFSIGFNISGFAPGVAINGSPYFNDPSGNAVLFTTATGTAGTVSITPDANGNATGNITGTMLTNVANGTWRVGLNIVGSNKTFVSTTLGAVTVAGVTASSNSTFTPNITTVTAGNNVTYSASYVGLTNGAGLYRVEFGTALFGGSYATESIAVVPVSGNFSFSRVIAIPASTTVTGISAYIKLIRIVDNAVLVNNSSVDVGIIAPAPTGITWAPSASSMVPGSTISYGGTVTGVYGAGRYTYSITEQWSDGNGYLVTNGPVVPDGNGNFSTSKIIGVSNDVSADNLQSKIRILRVSDGAVLTDTGFQLVPFVYPVPTITYTRTGGNNPAAPGDSEYYRATISNVHGGNRYYVRTSWTVNGGPEQNITGETIYGTSTIMDRGFQIPASTPVSGNLQAICLICRISDNAVVGNAGNVAVTITVPPAITTFAFVDYSNLQTIQVGGNDNHPIYGSFYDARYNVNAKGLLPNTLYNAVAYQDKGGGFQGPYAGTGFTTDGNGAFSGFVTANVSNSDYTGWWILSLASQYTLGSYFVAPAKTNTPQTTPAPGEVVRSGNVYFHRPG